MADDPVERIKKEADKKVQMFLLWKQLTFLPNPLSTTNVILTDAVLPPSTLFVITNNPRKIQDWMGCGVTIPSKAFSLKEPTLPPKQEVVSTKEYNGLDTID